MPNLRLSDWSHVAEIIGTAAVILSLIYVAYEINRNTAVTESAARQVVAAQDIAYLSLRLDSSILARAKAKKENGRELSALEHSQLIHEQHVNFRIFEHSYYQLQKGILEESVWARHEQIMRSQLSNNEHAREMWARTASGFSPAFAEFVERFRNEPGGN